MSNWSTIATPITPAESAVSGAVAARNCYATVDDLRQSLGLSGSGRDAELLACLDAASREAEGPECAGREFWTCEGVRYFDGRAVVNGAVLIDDCLSVDEFAVDRSRDGGYAEVWTTGSDYVLGPAQRWPKGYIEQLPSAQYALCPERDPVAGLRLYRASGVWGYGDGQGNRWLVTGITASVAETASNQVTLSATGAVQAGHTLFLGDEQVFVSSVDNTTGVATVVRGVNATEAAAHDAVPVRVATYPADVRRNVIWLAVESWQQAGRMGLESQSVGWFKESFKAISRETKRGWFSRVRR